MADLKKALDYVLENEGRGFEDWPQTDQPTNSGIIAADIAEYRNVATTDIKRSDVEKLSDYEIEAIYRRQYWEKIKGDQIKDPGIATCVFDIAVVRGVSVAGKYSQRVCNLLGAALVVDGQIGLHTTGALNLMDRKRFITNMENLQAAGFLAIVHAHPIDQRYLHGWMARARKLLTLI